MKKVLIADDEVALQRLVSVTLASDDYEILEASDGDRAWDLIQEHRPDVVLLDVMMPGMNGLDLARAIKGEPTLAGTRIILLTARNQPEDVEAGYQAGADHYLTKPFSPLELMRIIDEALGLD